MRTEYEIKKELFATIAELQSGMVKSKELFDYLKSKLETLFWIVEDDIEEAFAEQIDEVLSKEWYGSKKIPFKVGDRVCISAKNLFEHYAKGGENHADLIFAQVQKKDNYFDIYTRRRGLVCCDGEQCEIVARVSDSSSLYDGFILRQVDGDGQFRLSNLEFEVAVFG